MTRKNLKIFFLFFFAVITALIWYAVFYVDTHRNLIIDFFDVGQGDGIFFELPNHVQVLIDGGPGSGILAKLGSVMPFWDHTIDLVVLTHPHADHVDGLVDVLKRYKVGMVIESAAAYETPDYADWHRLLKEKNVTVVKARAGQHVSLSDISVLDILAPYGDFEHQRLKNVHDAMVVSKLRYGSTSVLFMGDAERIVEYKLLFSGVNLAADVLKIGHHGSKTSSSQALLDAVHPRYAVISVGRKNRYGHPHQEVVERIKAMGISLFRTDLDGDVEMESDGTDFLNVRRKGF